MGESGMEFDAYTGGPGANPNQKWVGLLLAGILFLAVSVITFSMGASMLSTSETDFFHDSRVEGGKIFLIFAVVQAVLGVVFIGAAIMVRASEQTRLQEMARVAEANRIRNVKEIAEAVKSTIKVRCRYCQTLNEEEASNCESCGAPL